MRKKILYIWLPVAFVLFCLIFISIHYAYTATAPKLPNTDIVEKPADANTFNTKQYSVDDPNSIWVVVNKKRPLPNGYVPPDLTDVGGGQMRAEAAAALNQLLAQATKEYVPMHVISAYRSYDTQKSTYDAYVQKDGAEQADTYSARPGYSEHQTGLAVDVGTGKCDLELCFGETGAGEWLVKNAPKFGFIIRFPQGKGLTTGYQYEPWHLRYVNKDLSAEMYKTNQVMEQIFKLPEAGTY